MHWLFLLRRKIEYSFSIQEIKKIFQFSIIRSMCKKNWNILETFARAHFNLHLCMEVCKDIFLEAISNVESLYGDDNNKEEEKMFSLVNFEYLFSFLLTSEKSEEMKEYFISLLLLLSEKMKTFLRENVTLGIVRSIVPSFSLFPLFFCSFSFGLTLDVSLFSFFKLDGIIPFSFLVLLVLSTLLKILISLLRLFLPNMVTPTPVCLIWVFAMEIRKNQNTHFKLVL